MERVKPMDVSKWFLKQKINGLDDSKNGNMKMQKLLFLAQMIYMYKNNGNTMFDEEFNAFKHGMVLQEVLWKYQDDYETLEKDSKQYIELPEDIVEILKITCEIFGECTSEELSDMTHQLKAWDKYYHKSILFGGKYNQEKSKVPYKEIEGDLYRIGKVLDAYYSVRNTEYNDEEEDY